MCGMKNFDPLMPSRGTLYSATSSKLWTALWSRKYTEGGTLGNPPTAAKARFAPDNLTHLGMEHSLEVVGIAGRAAGLHDRPDGRVFWCLFEATSETVDAGIAVEEEWTRVEVVGGISVKAQD